jgi:hypothetical protein
VGWAAAACRAWAGFQAWAAWEVGAAAEEEADDEADVAERSASVDSGVARARDVTHAPACWAVARCALLKRRPGLR